MKKRFIAVMLCLAFVLFAGCQSNQDAKNDGGINAANASDGNGKSASPAGAKVVEIKEKMFVAQTNEIYYNSEDYLGKTIKYEGIFTLYEAPDGTKYYSVIRYGPGCCGNDANCGFEVRWDKSYPKENDWVSVEGVLEKYDEGGSQYLRLALTSLDVKKERGAENVTQ